MRLSLTSQPASAGLRWFKAGFQELLRQPLAYAGLFATFMLAVLLVSVVPLVGGPLLMMSMPLLSLAFVMAAAGTRRGVPVRVAVLLAPWRSGPVQQRRRLFQLCLSYAVALTLLLWLAGLVDGGQFDRWLELTAKGETGSPEWENLSADPAVRDGLLFRLVSGSLLSMLYWHAPPLVQWADQGVAQALFSSVMALWRSLGAFIVYNLCWLAAGLGLMLLQLAVPAMGILTLPAWLLLSTAFYASLYASFVDSFAAVSPD
ncbi:hypothetical protein KAK06_07890 [Ideonella sp. 4Y11]|uniref:Uncharacterized protein n=1 Tax=Ideonella aquatica TaxID=2824119 RepID=A0A940YHK6_9BURK|nr:BPSS1780 family membrane protein [Ideonella aquatica]MBQ0958877.1 hypothetical protein [Ideonella aquatica]